MTESANNLHGSQKDFRQVFKPFIYSNYAICPSALPIDRAEGRVNATEGEAFGDFALVITDRTQLLTDYSH